MVLMIIHLEETRAEIMGESYCSVQKEETHEMLRGRPGRLDIRGIKDIMMLSESKV